MNKPTFISIVTPSFNQARFIGDALASVTAQNYRNHEHLVMDGLSKDGTVEILRKITAEDTRAQISWISEQDRGQSEALNKGFRLAKGEIVGWLNADDRYRSGCFQSVVDAFEVYPQVDIMYGDYLTINEDGELHRVRREIEFDPFILLYHHVLYIPTAATFFRRKVFEDENWLNETLEYAMDFDFFLRLSTRGYRFKHIPEVLAEFRLQPDSKTCSHPERQKAEHQKIVFAVAPMLRGLKPVPLKRIALSFFRAVACVRRCSEKMLRGYYWEQLLLKVFGWRLGAGGSLQKSPNYAGDGTD